MSTNSSLGVSTGELGRLANDLRSSGTTVAGHVVQINDNLFGASHAGAKYAAEGKDIQAGLEALRKRVDDWSTATGATADVIGAATVEYSNVDKERADQMNNQ
ncbi:hypothetical protein [Nocardia higoensis]|uniref:hypothetical protein n=1 Tax=Nocardia higoensis TaxID=228599 RepID=UPI000318476B|nr:hypothetical protein [Nocardia higoensis]